MPLANAACAQAFATFREDQHMGALTAPSSGFEGSNPRLLWLGRRWQDPVAFLAEQSLLKLLPGLAP